MRGRGRGHSGLGVKRNTKPSRHDHVEVVCAIADRQRLVGGQSRRARSAIRVASFASRPRIGSATVPERRPAGSRRSRLALDLIKPDCRSDLVGKGRESAGDEAGVGAARPHGRDQGFAAGREGDAARDHLLGHGCGQAGQQRDAFAQRGRERKLPAHGALGDGGDARLLTDQVGQLVDAFLADHGRVHVGERQLLAPAHCALPDHIDALIASAAAALGSARPSTARAIKGESTTTSLCSHATPGRTRAPRLERAPRPAPPTRWLTTGFAGSEINVATKDMENARCAAESKRAVLIAGPSASGKSALALALAQEFSGTIVNADSMQVYRDLRMVAARPSPSEEGLVPHCLYGRVDASENFRLGDRVAKPLERLPRWSRRSPSSSVAPGSTQGVDRSTFPQIPPSLSGLRAGLRARFCREGIAPLHAELRDATQ